MNDLAIPTVVFGFGLLTWFLLALSERLMGDKENERK